MNKPKWLNEYNITMGTACLSIVGIFVLAIIFAVMSFVDPDCTTYVCKTWFK